MGLYAEQTIDQNAHEPQRTQQDCFNSRDAQPGKSPPRSKLKPDAVHTYGRLFLTPEKLLLKLENYDAGSDRDGPGRIVLSGKSVRQRKVMGYEIPSRENKDRQTRRQIYNPKRDLENSKSNKGFQGKRKKSEGPRMN